MTKNSPQTQNPEDTVSSCYGTAPAPTALSRPILSVDFDGVIHSYTSGWKGADVVTDPPVDGAMRFLTDAAAEFEVNIYSSRSGQPGGIAAMHDYIAMHLRRYWVDLPEVADRVLSRLKFPTDKPSAMVSLDDRAITFEGIFPDVDDLLAFKPWNKR